MPYRDRSGAWFNRPEVLVAYQFIGAPDHSSALVNIAHEKKASGMYTCKSPAPPTFLPRTGLTFTGASSQWLDTQIYNLAPDLKKSVFVQYSGGTTGALFGHYQSLTNNIGMFVDLANVANDMKACQGDRRFNSVNAPMLAQGNYGFSGRRCFRNGVLESDLIPNNPRSESISVYIGAWRYIASGYNEPQNFFNGSMQAFVLLTQQVSDAAAREIAKQMAYCHLNPDWNAWATVRRYYYRPSATTVTGSVTADADLSLIGKCTWVSPPDESSTTDTTPALTFQMPDASTGPMHFHMELDTADTFDTGNLRIIKSHRSQAGWEYNNGVGWQSFPADGVDVAYVGNQCRYTVQSALSLDTWYRRVRGGTIQ